MAKSDIMSPEDQERVLRLKGIITKAYAKACIDDPTCGPQHAGFAMLEALAAMTLRVAPSNEHAVHALRSAAAVLEKLAEGVENGVINKEGDQ